MRGEVRGNARPRPSAPAALSSPPDGVAPEAVQRCARPQAPSAPYLCFQVTENEPLLLMLPVWAFTVEPETMSIRSGLKVLSDTPFAVAPEKLTVRPPSIG